MSKFNKKDKIEANEIYKELLNKIQDKVSKYKNLNYYIFDELLLIKSAIKYYEKKLYNETIILLRICIDKLDERTIYDDYCDNILLENFDDIITIDL